LSDFSIVQIAVQDSSDVQIQGTGIDIIQRLLQAILGSCAHVLDHAGRREQQSTTSLIVIINMTLHAAQRSSVGPRPQR
jgi:hypothetical protein